MSKTKPIELTTGHRTKEEIEKRIESQDKLKGDALCIEPTQSLTAEQLQIFDSIKSEMKDSNLLGNLDSHLLTQCANAISALAYIDDAARKKPSLYFNKDWKSAKKLQFDIFTKCCDELAMSPQSRAKLANINSLVKDQKEDPVLAALKDD